MIRIEHVDFTYPGGTRALDDVSLQVEPGGIRAILGRSGSGKTTLLMCLSRFLEPDSGTITVDGEDISELDEVRLRQSVGTVFQDLHLFPHMTVMENLTLAPIRVLEQPEERARERAREALARFGMEELADDYPAEISGGQGQRVAIARGLLLEPDYLLLDEPTSALDVQTGREFAEWLRSLEDETTFVIVTHDVAFAREAASSGVLLADGRVVAEGDLDAVVAELEGRAGGASG
ncbi:MAG: ATP-binding cassette domain-containing protein [Acidobacteriota bacterium]